MDGPMIYDESVGFVPAHNDAIMTNADRIRAMTDEEFSTEIDEHSGCPFRETEDDECLKHDFDCKECWLDWLKQEAKE